MRPSEWIEKNRGRRVRRLRGRTTYVIRAVQTGWPPHGTRVCLERTDNGTVVHAPLAEVKRMVTCP